MFPEERKAKKQRSGYEGQVYDMEDESQDVEEDQGG